MVFFTFLQKFGIVFVLIRKVYYSLALLHCIIYSLPCTAFLVPNVADNQIGTLTIFAGEQVLSQVPMVAKEAIPKLSWWDLFLQVLQNICMAKTDAS